MAFSPEQIHKLASLAKLRVEEEAVEVISSQIDNIMQLIDQMEQADTSGITPLSHPQDPVLRLREDVPTQTDMRDEFMVLNEHSEAGLFMVPKVID
ncbi:MAG: Asp-tRNA(Asn)/Glu-tRNA(Gln) amidotransferase subunit GatC [Arenicellales bacterium]